MDLLVLGESVEELIELTCSGVYVLSFNMEKPMVYYQPYPESDKLIDSSMIKLGISNNIKKRMGQYRSTFGYRKKEPPKTEDYWISKGYRDRFLEKCLGCERKDQHHHVEYIHIEPTPFINKDSFGVFHNNIKNEISNKFHTHQFWSNMDYYKKDIAQEMVEEISTLIKNEKE